MGITNGGLISSSSKTTQQETLALSDGLACFTGSFSGVTTTSISHGLNSTDLVVEFKDNLGNLLIPDTWSITNPNVIEAEFTPAATGDVTIIACIESGLAPITGGVVLLEGLSGIIDLDCPDDSVDISTSGQVINICALFTPESGALLQQKCEDINILSGLIGGGSGTTVNGISGQVFIESVNDAIKVITSGNTILLSGLFTAESGAILEQKCRDIDTLSGLIGTPATASGQAFYRYDGASGSLYAFSTDFSPLPLNDVIVEDDPFFTVVSGQLALRVEIDGLYRFQYDHNVEKVTSNTPTKVEGHVVLNGDTVVSGTTTTGRLRNLNLENVTSIHKEFKVELSAGDLLMFEMARISGNGDITFMAESTVSAQFIRE